MNLANLILILVLNVNGHELDAGSHLPSDCIDIAHEINMAGGEAWCEDLDGHRAYSEIDA